MDNNILDTIDMKVLGRELQQARVRKGLTQEEAAKVIDVARTTITAIEQGTRRIRAGELLKLAQAYDSQVSDFVGARPEIEMSLPQFRGPILRTEKDNELIAPYVEQLKNLARNYFELEIVTESPLARKYPHVYGTSRLPTSEAAESIAMEERVRLGLGDGQVPLLRDILEQDVGLRIFYYPLPAKFSAIYLYDDQVGGCIAVNRNHPEERRRWSLAHDYGHFLTSRQKPTVFIENAYQRKPESERLADDFANYFLMPTGGLKRRFNDIRRTKDKITAGDLCILAHYYGVSVEAMTRRLEDLKLLPTGIWDKLKEGGFKVRDAQQQLGLGSLPAREQKLPMRYQYLAIDAFDRELISEGLLSKFLEVNRLEARRAAEILRPDLTEVTHVSLTTRVTEQPLSDLEDTVNE
jgi:Zn-dependent peptidase ImmA (M78 family)/DNA-binding XRE family transcriptional regulator